MHPPPTSPGIVHAPRRESFATFAEYARARQRWIDGLNHFQRIEAAQRRGHRRACGP